MCAESGCPGSNPASLCDPRQPQVPPGSVSGESQPSRAGLHGSAAGQDEARTGSLLSRPPTGNSRDNKATAAYEAQFTAGSSVGDAIVTPFYRQGAEPREGHEGTTRTLRQDYRRMGKWHVGLDEGQQEGAEDREAS